MMRILEIACFNYESALIAAKAGADRIEFCSDFSSGGLTPDLKETEKLIKEISIPVFVMIRPQNNFLLSETQIRNSISEIRNFEEIGVKGFVIGSINNNRLDKSSNLQIIQSSNLPFTLHRAFDRTVNLFQTLEDAIEIGFNRILCSGGKGNAIDNIEMLKKLNEAASNRITIMPGGGVRSSNIEKLLETGCNEFHSSGILSGGIADEDEIKKIIESFNH